MSGTSSIQSFLTPPYPAGLVFAHALDRLHIFLFPINLPSSALFHAPFLPPTLRQRTFTHQIRALRIADGDIHVVLVRSDLE